MKISIKLLSALAFVLIVAFLVITLSLQGYLPESFSSYFHIKERKFLHESTIEDTNITLSYLVNQNKDFFYPKVSDIVSRKFFKIFKVDLESECPFWAMEKVCKTEGGCSVCKCDADDVPISWQITKKNRVNTFLGQELKGKKMKWNETNQQESWFPESDDSDYTYVNLLMNPETNTGYDGKEASKIWMTIYKENCFHGGKVEDMCLEERVFYRLLSGIHMTITSKISAYYFKNPAWVEREEYQKRKSHGKDTPFVYTYDMYLPNLEMFDRVIMRFPERIQNMFFLYSFTLRAMQKAKNFLINYDYSTDNPVEDAETKKLVQDLLKSQILDLGLNDNQENENLKSPVPPSSCCFDESCLFNSQCHTNGQGKQEFLSQMKAHFRNVSKLMDCVSCERCKLWAKLQMLGLSVALRIVMAESQDELDKITTKLSRNEIIALINSFKQQSQSIQVLDSLYILVWRRRMTKIAITIITIAITISISRVFYFIIKALISKKKSKPKKD